MGKMRSTRGMMERVLGALEIVAGYGTKRRRPGTPARRR
jgi:hypothetical protein